jgi:hypothetical protein
LAESSPPGSSPAAELEPAAPLASPALTLALSEKTQPSKGDAGDRAARPRQREAARRAIELEEQRERAEKELARARLAEYRAQNEEMRRYVNEQRRRAVDEEIAAGEKREETVRQLRAGLDKPLPHLRRSREEHEAAIAELGRFLDREALAEQDRLRAETDAALSRCIYEPGFRRRWLARHPGGVDHHDCDACRAYRREPPR